MISLMFELELIVNDTSNGFRLNKRGEFSSKNIYIYTHKLKYPIFILKAYENRESFFELMMIFAKIKTRMFYFYLEKQACT